jgi:hypoxanthine-DNA glycosylase
MKKGLGPIVDSFSRVLILGSFPGPIALKKKEYYAHPQNRFWSTMATITGQDSVPKDYKKKKILLANAGIGLWDVVASCERRGAGDANIKKEELNNITGLLCKYPDIKAVFFNGKKAESLFKKHLKVSIMTECLPSTSPANASIPETEKLNTWKDKLGKALNKKQGVL